MQICTSKLNCTNSFVIIMRYDPSQPTVFTGNMLKYYSDSSLVTNSQMYWTLESVKRPVICYKMYKVGVLSGYSRLKVTLVEYFY